MQPPAPQVLTIFRMLIEERTGIRYAAEDATLISDKLLSLAQEAGFESLLDYYYFLRYDDASGDEFARLTDALVVNETYFFRELGPLGVAIDEVVLPAIEASSRARIWSAACATGEEPLTAAMLLAQRGVLHRTEIVATDISQRAISRARNGAFGARALRSDSIPMEARGFLEVVQGVPRVSAPVRAAVSFSKLNLLDKARVGELGSFDLILCRNVLIYFSDETIQKVVAHLTGALSPNGVLLIGASESLLRFDTSLVCQERNGAFFYRKAA